MNTNKDHDYYKIYGVTESGGLDEDDLLAIIRLESTFWNGLVPMSRERALVRRLCVMLGVEDCGINWWNGDQSMKEPEAQTVALIADVPYIKL